MTPLTAGVAAGAAGLLAILALGAGPLMLAGSGATCTTPTNPSATNQDQAHTDRTFPDQVLGYDTEQRANAATITRVGAALAVPVRGQIIAVAVAIQESSLRNLDHGDRSGPDSLGLFQQRTAWGTDRADPATAARMFYTGGAAGQPGLLDIPHWQTLPLTRAAQAVQRSAHPDAYAAHESDATTLVTNTTAGVTPCTAAPGSTAHVIAYATAQLGLPYQWAGNGPAAGDEGFDCSGLTHAAYAAAGITLPRTAQTQYDAGPHLPPDAPLQPGDLLFYGTPTHVHHVGIYLGNNQMIHAPHAGATIRTDDYRWPDYLGATRPTH